MYVVTIIVCAALLMLVFGWIVVRLFHHHREQQESMVDDAVAVAAKAVNVAAKAVNVSAEVVAVAEKQSETEEQQENVMTTLTEPTLNIETESDRAFLDRLDAFIRQDMPTGHVEVGTLAEQMCLSRSQLNRKVNRITGMSTSNYSTQLRLKEACRILREEQDSPISVVAKCCGFDDPAYFARVFRRFTGQAPTDWRKG